MFAIILILLFSLENDFCLCSYQINSSNTSKNFNRNQSGITPFIYGGKAAKWGEAPWMCAIWDIKTGQYVSACVIIGRMHVLTAAHKIVFYIKNDDDYKNLRIHYNDIGTDWSTAVDEGEVVGYLQLLGQFDPKHLYDDIALIRIVGWFILDKPQAKSIALPRQDSKITAGSMATVAGWGATDSTGGIEVAQRVVDLPVIDHDYCKRYFKERQKGGYINDNMICAGYEDDSKGVCVLQGDSGNALVYDGVLYGIASFGSACTYPRSIGVFTRVSRYSDYISRQIQMDLG